MCICAVCLCVLSICLCLSICLSVYLCARQVYLIIADVLSLWGMTMEQLDFTDHAAVLTRLQALASSSSSSSVLGGRQLVVWLETPSNPQCKVTDIQHISHMARDLFPLPSQLVVIVDSTWATPYLLNPLLLGADFVMHSVTKYIGGHSDVLGGIVTASCAAVQSADQKEREGKEEGGESKGCVLSRLRSIQRVGGGVCGPLEAWLAARGLRTLPVRLTHQCQR